MSTKIDDLLAAEATAVEEAEITSDPDAALPTHVKVTRGHPRAKNLQVRFRDDEFEELREYAELQRDMELYTPGHSDSTRGSRHPPVAL